MPHRILIELPYLPPVSWCALIWKFPVVRLEACEHYQKGGWRNRCHIAGPNGLQRLSIPLLKGKHQQTAIRAVQIAPDDPWALQHWRSICTAYGNAPFFEHYRDPLQHFFETPNPTLFDFNLRLLEWLLHQLGFPGTLELSTTYEPPGCPGDYRNALRPNLDCPNAGFVPIPYPQVFADRYGFLPNLSALDLLLCAGKQAGGYVNSISPPPAAK